MSFAVGELSKTFDVPVLFDGITEPDETFSVTLGNPTGGITLGNPASSTVTITNVLATPVVISPAPATAEEGTQLTFTVYRNSGATAGTVNYATSDGTATAGSDYTATSGIITFAVGELEKTFDVPIILDGVDESAEQFTVTISSPTAGLLLGTTTISTVTVNDPPTPVELSPAAATTTDEGAQLTFTVSRATAGTAGTVDYATSDGHRHRGLRLHGCQRHPHFRRR